MYLSARGLTPGLVGTHGFTQMTKKGLEVYINAESCRNGQDAILFHELMVHGVLWCQKGFRRHRDTEERFARAQCLGAWMLLKSLGFRWPQRPRGIRALEAYARKVIA